jgi:hypothetical protein
MALDTWLAGNVPLGMALSACVVGLAWSGRAFLRDIAQDPESFWRGLLRVAPLPIALFVVWTTAFDKWRQLLEEPLRLSKRFEYQRIVLDPTSDELRSVTLILLGVSVLPVAALFARHVGGYVIQLVVLFGTIVMWAPLFAIRRRLDTNLALGFGGDSSSPLDLTAYALFLLFDWVVVGALILATYAMLAMIAALPLTLLLDLTRRRRPRPTGEARAFFAALSGQAARLEPERHQPAGR